MESLLLKIRLSVLWLFMVVVLLAESALIFMEPGGLEMMSSEMEAAGPVMFVVFALWLWVPLVMAFLSVTLRDSANRRVNMVLGIVFTALNIFHFIEHLAQPSFHVILFVGSTVVVTALIAWYAWKWPVQVSSR